MEKIIFRLHAVQRMAERAISADDVRDVLMNGETIQDYVDDTPYPSRLILGWREKRPLHVVAAYNVEDEQTIVITAYEPDEALWDAEFKRKK